MSAIDYALLLAYGAWLVGLALYVSRKSVSASEYYLGSKNLGAAHIGLSVAATDVGGGFSIGLGALGFTMGLSGSWLLFTGWVGALLSAVWLIPRIKRLEEHRPFFSYPQVMAHLYGASTGRLAALISFVGYLGFTAAQLMAGTKLANTLIPEIPATWMLFILALVAVSYTAIGGLRAVVYTDTIQWIIVILGLSCLALPLALFKLGGWESIRATLPADHLSLRISWQAFFNWMVAIVPIWFVAMTLYQRMLACSNEREAKRAWFVAGFFEWPIMAFLGVSMGMLAKVAVAQGVIDLPEIGEAQLDNELAIPLLLKHVLPSGLLGIVFAAYLSAVLSTADSCLMAASGNAFSDLLGGDEHEAAADRSATPGELPAKRAGEEERERSVAVPRWIQALVRPKVITFFLGGVAFLIASQFESVLNLMLYAYGLMISGLFVPTILGFARKQVSEAAAITSMLIGSGVYLGCEQIDTAGWNANFSGFWPRLRGS